MKIGIYTEELSPSIGGSYSFLNTIKKNIIASECKYEICFFFSDKDAPHYIFEDKITYINTFRKKKFIIRLKIKIKSIFGKYKFDFDAEFNALLKAENIDLLCIVGPYKLNISIPFIFIVWDLGHRMLPCFPELGQDYHWEVREDIYKNALYRATYIITGNETGKKEITDNYSLNLNKVNVIPFPIPDFCFENIDIPQNIDKIKTPFVFYPAQFWTHKNHISLVEAIALLKKKNTIINCYFTGTDYGNLGYIKEQIKKHNLEEQIFYLGFVDIPTLLYLYKNALAITYVSFLGPNNLPLLEAVSLGCPLIYSNIPGHIEQMEGKGIAVNATKPEEICDAIYSLYSNLEFRKSIISEELILSEKYRNYSYFEQLLKIFDEFCLYLKAWKNV